MLRVSFCDSPLSVIRHRVSALTFSFKRLLLWNHSLEFDQTSQDDPWVVPYQSCSNHSIWLLSRVTGSKNRFSKCNFQKSTCLKLHSPEVSQFYIELYKENYFLKLLPLLNHLWKFDQTQQERFLVPYQNCWNDSNWLLERLFKLCP